MKQIDPSGIADTTQYSARFGRPQLAQTASFEGRTYTVYHGAMSAPFGLATVPSSLPVYVFDEQGRFVSWHADPGADESGKHLFHQLKSSLREIQFEDNPSLRRKP